MANEIVKSVTQACYEHTSLGYSSSGPCAVGNGMWVSGSRVKGGLRFTSIAVSGSVNWAEIKYVYGGSNNENSGDWKFYVYGIDEDNTGSFSSNPFGRTHTSNRLDINQGGGGPQYPGSTSFNVTSIFNEIVTRGGWSSGNAMGFLFENNGSSTDVYASASTSSSYLVYRQSAEPNFKPTPKSVTAPSLPDALDYGIKISKPGINVLEATEEELFYTSRRDQLKVYMEGEVDITGTTKTIAHNLGYKPFVMMFIKENGLSVWKKYPSFGTTGFYVDGTNLYIDGLVSGDKIYYYIFIDQLV